VDPDHGLTVDTPSAAGVRLPWRNGYTAPHLGDADDWWAAMRRLILGAYLRAGVAEGPARRAAGGFRDHYLDPAHWSVFPDSAAALDRLSAAGYQHMIVSNHVPELRRLVSALGLADHFDEVLTSASVGFEKPHPGIFRCALERAGSPRAAHMVGDNPTADVQGARAVRLPTILVRGPNGVGLADAATEISAADKRPDVTHATCRGDIQTALAEDRPPSRTIRRLSAGPVGATATGTGRRLPLGIAASRSQASRRICGPNVPRDVLFDGRDCACAATPPITGRPSPTRH
jgi:putative hydrolase of the HAD superfamily